MAVTVAGKNYTQISSCDDAAAGGTWDGSPVSDTSNYKEGASSISDILKGNGNNDWTFTPTASVDLSGTKHLRIWFLGTQGGIINTKALGGIQLWVSDGSNTGYWFMEGSDTYAGGWINLAQNMADPVSSGTKPTAMNAITTLGIRLNLTGTAKNADNTWIDNLCVADGLIAYGDIDSGTLTCTVAASAGTFTVTAGGSGDLTDDGFRIGQSFTASGYTNGGNNTTKTISSVNVTTIIVTDNTGLVDESGTGDERLRGYFDFDEVYEGDAATTLGIGIARKIGGQYFFTGSLEIGDSVGTNDTKFQTKQQVAVFENRPVDSNLYNITAVDNGTGTTEFILGSKSGTAGIEGSLIRVAETTQTPKYDIDGSTDTDISDFMLYGSTFLDADSISLPPDATNIEVINCNFESCGEVLADTCDVTNCNFVSANDQGVRMSSQTHNITSSNFISCTHGINIPSAGTYPFTNLVFTSCTYDIENSGTSATVIVNASGTSNVATYENTDGGNTTINNNKSIDVHVQDKATDNIQNAVVAIYKSSDDTEVSNSLTDVDGNIATASVPVDTAVYIRIRKSTSGTRYFPIETVATASSDLTLTITMTEDTTA